MLKTAPDYDSILKSPLPHQMKLSLINKMLYDKPTKQVDIDAIIKSSLPENVKLKILSELAQSVQPDIKPSFFGEIVEESKPSNEQDDYSYMAYSYPKSDKPKQQPEEGLLTPLQPAKFVPKFSEKSTPMVEKQELFTPAPKESPGSPKKALTLALREIENFISPSGAVFSKENADFVKGSDINAIVKFLSKPSFADKPPNGTKEVLKRIILDKPQVIQYIKNLKYREIAEKEYKKVIELKAKIQKPETPQTSTFGKWLNY